MATVRGLLHDAAGRTSMHTRRTAAAVLPLLTLAMSSYVSADSTDAQNTPQHGHAATLPSARGGGENPARTAVVRPTSQPFNANIDQLARSNSDYRHVVFTGLKTQIALMSIPAGSDIGEETHAHVEQLLVIVSGSGIAEMNGVRTPIGPGSVVVASPGIRHDVIATGTEPLRLYTVYSPPNHLDGRVHATKADAEADQADEAFARRVR
jgi:mannose-6-phosphate isomerase-like protein (cupin superfamily)